MSTDQQITRRQFIQHTTACGATAVAAAGGVQDLSAAEKVSDVQHQQRWQLGCWTRPWASRAYQVAMDEIADAGFNYIALTGAKTRTGRVIAAATTVEEAQQVGEEARNRGLHITHVYGGGQSLHEGSKKLKKMIDNVQAARAQSVVLTRFGNQETYEACIRSAIEGCQYAAKKNITITIKPHGGMIGSGPLLRQAVQKINQPGLEIMYDPGNIFFYSDGKVDPVDDCVSVRGLVRSISIKDYQHPKNVTLTPGTGQVRFPTLFTRLKQGGFHGGPVMIEMVSSGDTQHTRTEVIKTRKYLEALLGIN